MGHETRQGGMKPRELAIVTVVVGIVILMAAKSAADRHQQRKREITIERILAVQEALEKYAIDNAGRFPPSKDGLKWLVEKPPADAKPAPLRWRGPYLPSREYLYDGWGRPLRYCRGGRGDPPHAYELWSPGRDNSDRGEGLDADIDVWDPDSLVP